MKGLRAWCGLVLVAAIAAAPLVGRLHLLDEALAQQRAAAHSPEADCTRPHAHLGHRPHDAMGCALCVHLAKLGSWPGVAPLAAQQRRAGQQPLLAVGAPPGAPAICAWARAPPHLL